MLDKWQGSIPNIENFLVLFIVFELGRTFESEVDK